MLKVHETEQEVLFQRWLTSPHNRRHEASLNEPLAPDANELAGAPITPKAPNGLGDLGVGAGLPNLEYQLAG